jgi:hypothetical protein
MAIQMGQVCRAESVKLVAYCESKFPVGEGSGKRLSVTGEEHVELALPWAEGLDSAEAARLAAQEHFDQFSKDKSGTLYWRSVADIGFSPHRQKYAYFMRLLISDKPRKD